MGPPCQWGPPSRDAAATPSLRHCIAYVVRCEAVQSETGSAEKFSLLYMPTINIVLNFSSHLLTG